MAEKKSELALPISPAEYNDYLRRQLALPWKEQRSLIQCRDSLNEAGVRKAVEIAALYRLPLDQIAMIRKGGRLVPYVMARGINWRLQMDPRGLKSITTEILKWATREDPEARVRCTVEFANGERFVAHSSHSLASESNPEATPDFITKKCETQAMRRAGLMAVGIPFMTYEDELDFQEWRTEVEKRKAIEAEVKELKTPRNVGEFLVGAFNKGLTMGDILGKLGLESPGEIEDAVFAKLNIKAWSEIEDLDEALDELFGGSKNE